MKINTKRLVSISAVLQLMVSFLSPLALVAPRAAAAADTCTWTGGGTPVVDNTNTTLTFDIADPANWSGCDNGAVPEAGDTLEFPANAADVDPLDAEDDDYAWEYIIDNTLVDGTNFAGINFTGDTGTDNAYDDVYHLIGNDIVLDGNVDNNYIGNNGHQLSHFLLKISVNADTTLDLNNAAKYLGSTYANGGQIEYGANQLTICDASYTATSRYSSINGLNGDGDIIIDCSSGASIGADGGYSVGRDVIVNKGQLQVNGASLTSVGLGVPAVKTITVEDGASLYTYINDADPYSEVEIKSAFTFNGGPEEMTQGPDVEEDNYTYSSETDLVNRPRLIVYYTEYDADQQVSFPRNVKFTGDIEFSEDFEIRHSANVNIAGKIIGNNKAIKAYPGSYGSLNITSADNTSSTTGELKSDYQVAKIIGEYGDGTNLWSLTISPGYFTYLGSNESKAGDVTVQAYGKFGGLGTVGDLAVNSMAVYAPGLSPGCINSNDLTISGTYEIEIAGTEVCSGYDSTNVTGTVDVTGGTLSLAFLDDFVPAVGAQFTIISNDGSDDVTGQFAGLDEGAEVEVDGVTFTISYAGGDGNDVVLTVASLADGLTPTGAAAPGVPDTGAGSILSNPFVSVFAATIAAGALLASRKLNSAKK